jgi:predicted nucleic acid-binding protein
MAEFVALAEARRLPRQPGLQFLTGLLENPTIRIVWVDEVLHRAAMSFLRARLDKSYSLCDAVSFLLMRQWGIQKALTTDHHFEQEGFERLLRA